MKVIKIFSDISDYQKKHREDLHPLLKPFVGKGKDFDDASRIKMYGISEKEICLTSQIEEADVGLIAMSWNFYIENNLTSKAIDFINLLKSKGLRVFTWNAGDEGVKLPFLKGVVVQRQSGYRSKLPSWHQGMPVFFGDPIKRFFDKEEVFLQEKQHKPVIGFCGQAKGSLVKYLFDIARTSYRNIKFYTGLSYLEPQTIYPSTLRRARILKKVEKDTQLEPNFIIRSKYRAGAKSREEKKKTTLEFYDNMVQSDYILCMRGGGNFSVRVYEALAMGRIPIFVNTDCLLPFSQQIDWKKHMVWVEEKEIPKIGEIVLNFHNNLSNTDFQNLQLLNRKLWLEKLSFKGFFKSLF